MAAPGIHLMRSLTPLHNGSGQGLGDLDRPIVREKTTNYPYVQGKTIKGAALARARLSRKTDEKQTKGCERAINDAFGASAGAPGGGNQGLISIVEAQLLLFPVRSLAGTFVWTTSRLCLARFATFLKLAGKQELQTTVESAMAREPAAGTAIGPSFGNGQGSQVDVTRLNGTGPHVLEGLVLKSDGPAEARQALATLANSLAAPLFAEDAFWTDFFTKRLLLLSGSDFDHLIQSATAVEANIKIDETGITHDGSLRYTEFLPAETVLYSHYAAAPLALSQDRVTAATTAYEAAAEGELQLGADESAGKGIVRVVRI